MVGKAILRSIAEFQDQDKVTSIIDLTLLVYYEWFAKVTDALGAYLAGGLSGKLHRVIIYELRKDD